MSFLPESSSVCLSLSRVKHGRAKNKQNMAFECVGAQDFGCLSAKQIFTRVQ